MKYHLTLVWIALFLLSLSGAAMAISPLDLDLLPKKTVLVCQMDVQRSMKSPALAPVFQQLKSDPRRTAQWSAWKMAVGIDPLVDLSRVTLGMEPGRKGKPRTTLVYKTRPDPEFILEKLEAFGRAQKRKCQEAGHGTKKCTGVFRKSKKRKQTAIEIDGVAWAVFSDRIISGAPPSTLTRNKALGRRRPSVSKSVLSHRRFAKLVTEMHGNQAIWCGVRYHKTFAKIVERESPGSTRGFKYGVIGLNLDPGLRISMVMVSTPTIARRQKEQIHASWQRLFANPMMSVAGLSPLKSRLKLSVERGALSLELTLNEAETLRLRTVVTGMLQNRQSPRYSPRMAPKPPPPPPGKSIRMTPR